MTLPGLHIHSLTVPGSAIDVNGHANNLEYLRWMQDAATAHSDACGWTLARYQIAGTTWVVRAHTIDYLRPAFEGDVLRVLTWVAGFEARESPRHYLFWRPLDRKLLARACTLWVYVEAASGRATRVPEDIRSAFQTLPDEDEVVRGLRTGSLSGV